MTGSARARETSLYAAVKEHLERLGYEAKGEVCGCDIVAVRPGEPPFLVITELKLGFTLDLVLQGVARLAAADEVWLAVRATRRGRDRDGRARKLCRLLGFGLLAVDPLRRCVEVLAEPGPYRPRPDAKRRAGSTASRPKPRSRQSRCARLSRSRPRRVARTASQTSSAAARRSTPCRIRSSVRPSLSSVMTRKGGSPGRTATMSQPQTSPFTS